VTFTPNGELLVSGSDDKTIKVWDVAARSARRTLKGHLAEVVCVAASPDGRWLASGSSDHVVKLWEIKTGLLRADLRGHSESVTGIGFSPNGKLLASGSNDRTVRLWHVPPAESLTRESVKRLTGSRLADFGVVHAGDLGPVSGGRLRFSLSQ